MRITVKPTDIARSLHPEEKFQEVSVEASPKPIPLDVEVEVTEQVYNALFHATFPHPTNNFPCRYFDIVVHSTVDAKASELGSKVVENTKLFAAIYASLMSHNVVKPADLGTSTTAIYQHIVKGLSDA